MQNHILEGQKMFTCVSVVLYWAGINNWGGIISLELSLPVLMN